MSADVPEPHNEQPTSAPRPEEMRASFNLRVGEKIVLQGSARWTPAGVICAGITAVGMLLGIAAIMKAARTNLHR
jgi:hypothetical protein